MSADSDPIEQILKAIDSIGAEPVNGKGPWMRRQKRPGVRVFSCIED